MKNEYVKRIWADVQTKNANEPEFLQAVQEVLTTLDPMVAKMQKQLESQAVLERFVEPERVIMF
ncbi:MAG: NADP-specific glutamate dehydrogenase, partial [Treponema sp.]|nr:NADP-specific glutamate dehydrogenase [Treponema sp.]